MGVVTAIPFGPQGAASLCRAHLSPADHLAGIVVVLSMAVDLDSRAIRALYAEETRDFRAEPDDVYAWLVLRAEERVSLIPRLAEIARSHSCLGREWFAEQVAEAAQWQELLNAHGSAV